MTNNSWNMKHLYKPFEVLKSDFDKAENLPSEII